MLDASKAFDRLRYDKMFEILEKKGLHPQTLRLLIHMYKNQVTRTVWQSEHSEYFSTSNGIRQGGVASPVLFTLYMDVLIERLEAEKIGCHIGSEFYGIMCYADDVTLVAPTTSALQKMIQTCEQLGVDFDVKYNAGKSVCIQLGGLQIIPHPNIIINGESLKWEDSVKLLGNIVNSQLNDNADIKRKQNDFLVRTNAILARFQHASRQAKIKLFTGKCCSFYGSQMWVLKGKSINELAVSWRKAVRWLLGLPRTTKSALLPYLMKCNNLKEQLGIRFIKFIKTILSSDNEKAKYLLKHRSKHGTVQQNIDVLAAEMNIRAEDIITGNAWVPKYRLSEPVLQQRATAITEFMDLMQTMPNERDNVNDILIYLCTTNL